MKILNTYNLLIASLALLTASCNQVEDNLVSMPEGNDAYIQIVSGQVGYSSRGVDDEPQVEGQCNADRLIVYQYYYNNLGLEVSQSYNPSNMSYKEQYETDVDHYSDPEGYPYLQSDKWVRQSASLEFRTTRTSFFAFPALAYTNADKDKFNVNYEGKLDEMSLELTGNITPEIYFGRVEANGYAPDAKTGIYMKYKTSGNTETQALTGRLYRIVSQINITISNVNPDLVERMTMELSNVPTKIGLYADHRMSLGNGSDHGYHYPIVIANASQQSSNSDGTPIVVCETSNFRNGEAKLSTFLLPSEVGRTLYIHVYFKDGSNMTIKDKSYEILPPKSYYIPDNIALAYFSSEPLCVYNATENKFYSFSNVRVNITGDFDNFFPDRVNVDMNVEICNRYDNDHKYGDIDYN